MEQKTFEHEMHKAKAMQPENQDYWMGYQRGLRRLHHGENFGTEEEHALWMAAIDSDDESRSTRGRGYRDGYRGFAARMNLIFELQAVEVII